MKFLEIKDQNDAQKPESSRIYCRLQGCPAKSTIAKLTLPDQTCAFVGPDIKADSSM